MAQYDFGTIDPVPTSGTQLSLILNQWRNAVHTLHQGSSRPTYAVSGMFWIDNSGSPWLLKIYDGTNDITVGPIVTGGFSGRLERGTARPAWAANGTLWVNNSGGTLILNYYDGTTDIAMGAISPSIFGMPVGIEAAWPGPKEPTGWLFEFGQAVSRTTYAALLAVLTVAVTGTTSSGSVTVTGVSEDLSALGLV